MPAIAISLIGCALILQSGNPWFTVVVFWMKLFTDALLGSYLFWFRRPYLYFYHNLGYGTVGLFAGALAIDFVVWVALTYVTLQWL